MSNNNVYVGVVYCNVTHTNKISINKYEAQLKYYFVCMETSAVTSTPEK